MAVRLFEGRDHAAAYLQYRVAPQELISRILNFVNKKTPQQLGLAVDVGCGSGQGTVLLAPHFTRVVGIDVSPAQLEMALTKNNPPNVSFRQGPAEELPFGPGEVDLLTAMTAAHWFDRQKFLVEADRVLRPGGCLALLSYSMNIELEYGEVSAELNHICNELYTALTPFRDPYLGSSTFKVYADMFDSCSYPDKECNECLPVKYASSLGGYIKMVETFSPYQKMHQNDPVEAKRLSEDIQSKLMSAMNVSSPDTELTSVFKYFYWFARKPSPQ